MAHRLSVLGTGYLGATHAVCMAELGYRGPRPRRRPGQGRHALQHGEVPFFEPGLEPLAAQELETGRLRFTTSYEEAGRVRRRPLHLRRHAAEEGRVRRRHDLRRRGRPTASCRYVTDRAPDRRQVDRARRHRRAADRRASWPSAPAGADVELVWNPEFLREGFAVEDTLHPGPLVFGVDQRARPSASMREVYAPVLDAGTPVVITDLATAELVKVAANAFLATKISFINAMAEVCEVAGADVTKLSEALGHDTRIGGRFLHAGLGFGGGCLPKDIRAFMARAGELGVDQALSLPHARSTPSTCAAAPAWSTSTRELLGGTFARRQGRRARRRVQARQRRHPRLPGARRRRLDCSARAPRSLRLRPRGHGQRAAKYPELDLRRQRRRGGRATPTSCCTSPSGASSATWTPAALAGAVEHNATSSTAATPSTPRCGATPAGPTARSAGPRASRSTAVLTRYEHLLHDQLDRGGHRDRDQRTHDAQQ